MYWRATKFTSPVPANRSPPVMKPSSRGARKAEAPTVNTEKASAQYYIDGLRLALASLGWNNVGGPITSAAAIVWSEEPAKRPRMLALPGVRKLWVNVKNMQRLDKSPA